MKYLEMQNLIQEGKPNTQLKATASSTWSFDVVIGFSFSELIVLKSVIAKQN